MGLYKNTNGVLTPIAGRGKAEYGASTVRKGILTLTGTPSGGWWYGSVTFSSPFPDDDYLIVFEPQATVQVDLELIQISNKTANGFSAQSINPQSAGVSSWDINYTAYKLYTDNEYNGLLNNQRYSTDEIDTGKTWIDGKPIYRKVFSLTSRIGVGDIFSISNLDKVINMGGYGYYTTNRLLRTFPWEARDASVNEWTSSGAKYYADDGSVTLETGSAIYIEYTKTTD